LGIWLKKWLNNVEIEQVYKNCGIISLPYKMYFQKSQRLPEDRGAIIMANPAQTSTQQNTSTLNLNSIMIGTAQASVLAAFYEKVFGRPADMVEGDWYMWQVGSCALSIGTHSEVTGQAKEPQRIIMNLETKQVKEEFERLKSSVTVIKEPYEMGGGWIATFADPDGNYVQLMTPWEQE
jgi:predicted enzyme related to lactoylglutathione lyase